MTPSNPTTSVSSRPVPPFVLLPGTRPLLLSIPHVGTYVPPALADRFTDAARPVPDTDWHLDVLYAFARDIGASVLMATHSRYVIDLNRPPDDANLYPGRDTTGLCPVDTFDREPIYRDPADRPDAAEIARRLDTVWRPYHDVLQQELGRLKARFGTVALWEAHSIRSVLPRFFEGRLPDLNFGTADGRSCDPVLAHAIMALAAEADGYSSVLNGRYKGGYITRRYGDPAAGVHAIQLEKTQRNYMQEAAPFTYLPQVADGLQPHLRRMLERTLAFVEGRSHGKDA